MVRKRLRPVCVLRFFESHNAAWDSIDSRLDVWKQPHKLMSAQNDTCAHDYNRARHYCRSRGRGCQTTCADDLEATFAAHLDAVARRTARALEASGFIAACWCIPAAPPMVFADDQHYPVPGERPLQALGAADGRAGLLRLLRAGPQAAHAVPSAARTTGISRRTCPTPTGPGISTSTPVADRAAARAAAARGPEPHGVHRRALSRARRHGASAPSTREHLIDPAGLRARRQDALRARLPARSEPAGRARARRRGSSAFAAGASEFEIELAFLARLRPARAGAAVQPDHRAQRGRARCCTTRCCERTAPAERHSLLIDAGAEFAGYASDITRTYSHDRCRLRHADRARWTRCSSRSARACAPAWTGGTCTSPRIG